MKKEKKQKQWYKRWWAITLFIFIGIIIIGSFFGDKNTQNSSKLSDENICTPNWQCTEWSECSQTGTQTRTCSDSINCGILTGKPKESQSCTPSKTTYPLEVTINSVRTAKVITGMAGAFIDAPKEGEIALIIDFSIKNLGIDPSYDFNPNYMKVIDSKGYSYGYSWDSSSLSKFFDMGTIPEGQIRSGELAFNVPETETKFSLVAESFFGGYQGYVELTKS